MKKAFTLVELLIVITLISILSVAVLATINPIEQTNKARDAQFKNDAAEVLSAYERYFASQNGYPWNIGTNGTLPVGPAVIGSTDPLFGVLATGGVATTLADLINTSELKQSFQGKAPFLPGVRDADKLWLYHNGTDSNYVCYVPKAKVNRTGANASKLKCMDPTAGTDTLHSVGEGTPVCEAADDADWTSTTISPYLPNATLANMMCVPE